MTKVFTACLWLCAATAPAASQDPRSAASQDPQPEPPSRSLKALIDEIEARERAVQSVALEIETRGTFPDGSEFRTRGTLHVLGRTHMRSVRTAHFGEGLDAETETVVTPDGMQMRERDPVQGEVFTVMTPQLLRRVESARDHLGQGGALGGLPSRPSDAPLGSAVLESMNRQFALEVSAPRIVDGQRVRVVNGPIRADLADAERAQIPFGADHVDILVRDRDVAVVRMTHLRGGEPVLDVRITKLELDVPLKPDDEVFRLAVPPRARLLDVMEHPPAQAQVLRLFQEAEAAGWKDPGSGAVRDGAAGSDGGSGTGSGTGTGTGTGRAGDGRGAADAATGRR